MHPSFVIQGGKLLAGPVTIQGSKNAILPLLAACLLTDEPCVLESVPAIQDVETMVAIAEGLGALVEWERDLHRLTIEARHISSTAPDETLARKLRGSVLFAGPLIGRFRHATLPYPGGDAIGARPLTALFRALEELGVEIVEERLIELKGGHLHGSSILMEEPSVTATENTILAAVLAPGMTTIALGAGEPHIQELIHFLCAMGADIAWRDQYRIEIAGVARLHGARYTVNPDELEVSAFTALAAATRSELALRPVKREYLDAFFLQCKKMGVMVAHAGNELKILKPALGYRSFRIQSGIYPKLGSDHVPPFAVLATQAEGTSLIHDWLYENRLRYVTELQKMGANCELVDPHRALITGPTVLTGGLMESPDIRSGMTLVIAALVAEGESVIERTDHLDRGYEKLEERLRGIGAEIRRN